MIRLLLETATDVCSVAVARGQVILAEHTAAEVFQHASHLTLFIQRVMAKASIEMGELDEIVLSDGPGSYTSLRVGAATAKGLCVALPGLTLHVVPTLAALAFAVKQKDTVALATINSRRGEVYGQLFMAGAPHGSMHQGAGARVQGELGGAAPHDLWIAPQNIRLTEEGWWDKLATAAGTGAFTITGPGQQRIWDADGVSQVAGFAAPDTCRATHLLAPRLGTGLVAGQPAAAPEYSRQVEVASYEPLYVNPPFVTKSKKKILG